MKWFFCYMFLLTFVFLVIRWCFEGYLYKKTRIMYLTKRKADVLRIERNAIMREQAKP